MKYITGFSLLLLILTGCNNNFPLKEDISRENFTLTSQDNGTVKFPSDFEGKVKLVGFIFTACPDICPMTVLNLQRIREAAKEKGIKNIEYLAISFDPERDTPQVLKKYAEIRDIKTTDYTFLTGEKPVVEKLLKKMNIVAVAADSSYNKKGELNYMFIHTDRITLVDKDNRIRKEYKGSEINLEEIVNDLEKLGD